MKELRLSRILLKKEYVFKALPNGIVSAIAAQRLLGKETNQTYLDPKNDVVTQFVNEKIRNVDRGQVTHDGEIRARRKGDQHFLTIKGSEALDRYERQEPITSDEFDYIVDAVEGEVKIKDFETAEDVFDYASARDRLVPPPSPAV